jgi:hypothetical protein
MRHHIVNSNAAPRPHVPEYREAGSSIDPDRPSGVPIDIGAERARFEAGAAFNISSE